MATLADLMESARNYTGKLDWQRGKDIERIAGGDPDKAAILEQLMSLGEGGGHSVGGLAGIFAGKSAKTADLGEWIGLAKAQKMHKSGANRDEIWNTTGWFQGPDKQWRFEIPDTEAVSISEKSPQVVSDVLRHQGLSEAYPDARDIKMAIGKTFGDARGTYSHGLITLREPGALSTMLHELQHHIQEKEGFAGGGNSVLAFRNPETFQFYKQLKRELPGWNDVTVQEVAAKQYYNRLAGEAEARLVQKRQHMTPEERMKTPPWTMYDVPEDEQIVKFRPDYMERR